MFLGFADSLGRYCLALRAAAESAWRAALKKRC